MRLVGGVEGTIIYSLVAARGSRYSWLRLHGLLITAASLVAEPGLQACGLSSWDTGLVRRAPGEKKPDLGCRKPVRATGAPSARDCAGHGASGLDGQHLLLLGSLWGTHNAELFPTVQAQEPLKHRSLCTTQPQVTGNPGRRCVHQRQCLWVPGARPGSRTQQLCRLPAAYKQEMSGNLVVPLRCLLWPSPL